MTETKVVSVSQPAYEIPIGSRLFFHVQHINTAVQNVARKCPRRYTATKNRLHN